jgi:hypothetical protein
MFDSRTRRQDSNFWFNVSRDRVCKRRTVEKNERIVEFTNLFSTRIRLMSFDMIFSFRIYYESQEKEHEYEREKKNRITWTEVRRRALREYVFDLTHVVVTTAFNAEDHILYSTYNLNVIIRNETSRSLKADTWNLLGNYQKTTLIWFDDEEIQLRSVILHTLNDNDLAYSMKMSLFHRLKLLGHSSIMLHVQYGMINVTWICLLKIIRLIVILRSQEHRQIRHS